MSRDWWRELVASAGVLTALRSGPPPRRRSSVLAYAPVIGVALGGLAAAATAAGAALWPGPLGALVAGAAGIATLAVLTRGLHLDGLADTADGLGRLAPAPTALEVMARGDVGPFGVVTLVLVLLTDVAALGHAVAAGRGAAAVLVAAVTGRLAMLQAGVPGVPAARPDGLGAWVAGSVPRALAYAVTAVLTAAAVGVPAGLGLPWLGARLGGGLLAGCLGALLLRRRAVRRLGGITGDVLGALGETATMLALLVAALR